MSDRDLPAAEAGTGDDVSRSSMLERVRSVGMLTLISRILGLFRDSVMATQFGNGVIRDAFTVAFRIPNLARQLFGEGALSTAFLPVFIRDREQHGRESAFRTATALLISLSCFLFWMLLTAEGVLFLVWQFCELTSEARLLLGLTAALLPYLLLVCVLAQTCAIMHGLDRFSLPALFPILLNTLWIAAATAFWTTVENEITRIYLISGSIVVIGAVQLALSYPALKQLGFTLQTTWRKNTDRVREIRRTMLPVVLGLSITQINTLLDSAMAWILTAPADLTGGNWLPGYPLTEGTASALYLGQRMYQFPLGVFGVALGTIIFPLLTLHAERNNMTRFRDDLLHGLRLVIGIGIPASAGLVLIASPLTEALFQYGAFDDHDGQQTASIIMMYGLGVWASCGLLIINRAFYAMGDRHTPLKAGLYSILLNLAASLTFVWHLGGRGLALATAMSAVFQCCLAARLLARKWISVEWRTLLAVTCQSVFCTALMVIAVSWLNAWLSEMSFPSEVIRRVTLLGSPVAAGLIVYLTAARFAGPREPFELLRRTWRKTQSTPDSANPSKQD